MCKECYFNIAIKEYMNGVEIESRLTGTKYKYDFKTSRHMKKRDYEEEFKPSGSVGINEINNTWLIRNNK
ncbi:MAG: hypothetical protein ACRDDY_07850 [Clostridium sp.]|uniref:hypothetical protein n=1 Tax=Clostridium sp. TaxID=1506 RepID=UPI003EE61F61